MGQICCLFLLFCWTSSDCLLRTIGPRREMSYLSDSNISIQIVQVKRQERGFLLRDDGVCTG